jgi:hypothetical protein
MKKLLLNIQMFAILVTDGTHDTQDRFGKEVKALFRQKNNLRQFFGRNYEGSPKAGKVRIPVRDTEVSVADYDIGTGTPITFGATVYLDVLVNKNKAINELIDGQEAASVPDDLVAQRIQSGSFSLQRTEELDSIAVIRDSTVAQDTGGGQTNPANPTYETSVTILSASTAYNAISASVGELLDIGVEPEDITVGISTATETFLLEDVKFTNTASQIGSERVMKGVIGMIRGAEVVRSSNLGLVDAAGANVAFDGTTVEYIAFSGQWAQTGDEWMVEPTIRDLTNEFIGSSALQGRDSYFNALTDTRGARVKARTT